MVQRLKFIVGAVADFSSTARFTAAGILEVDLRGWRPSDTDDVFHLIVSQDRDNLVVGENRAISWRLPNFCAERHINEGATLCLFWQDGEDAIEVIDHDSAVRWLSAVVNHLGRQWIAEKRRKWVGPSRPHGDAARHEAEAEKAAALFGQSMLADFRLGRICIKPSAVEGHISGAPVRLIRNGRRIFSKRVGHQSVANLRGPCPCESGRRPRTLRSCSNHADAAAALIDSLIALAAAERDFLGSCARQFGCCHTIDDCPLASKVMARTAA
jgi:hypothetical protein